MKCPHLLSISTAAVALLASAAALAQPQGEGQNAPEFARQRATPMLSRADVRADLAQARHDGVLAWGEIGYADDAADTLPLAGVHNDRAQVRADARQARRLGLIAPGEAAQLLTSTPTRADQLHAAARVR